MHTTLSSKWPLSALLVAAFLLTGCGVTAKKTFLGEPVQENAGKGVPISSDSAGQTSFSELARNPALDSAEATGVQKLLNIITPYRIDIQQGNFVSQEMLEKVQPGMTKEQVRFALGTPLLTDIFHAARWDYIFRLQKPSGKITNNRVILYFEDNRVTRIVNDPLPDETQYLEAIAGPAPKKKVKDSDEKAAAEQDAVVPVSTDTTTTLAPDATPATTETPETDPESHEGYRGEPVTDTTETTPVETYRSEPRETAPSTTEAQPVQTDEYRAAPVETDRQESEPVSPRTTETTSATTGAEPVRTYTPEPARQAEPRRAATTVTRDDDEPDEDFRAAPNSTMQLHELMQPQ
ncbi:outer membrane protein assembly factor BamE [Oxalobacter sp. OttesenSCG-928-P03]|nr:outer membrane protein assembly factor BamE [Oxalobacter sp. OttesenSCG-928-P03]